ncbi:MAG: bifunctional oligoribonuclease/PAP phosphatase NrnA [Clostridia bacterium]|nr:bifunctional oligoribonuclease/PAP phosphatase NrnA [Clostridia bacterium]
MTHVKQQIFDKIKSYDRIMLFRHIRLDGDCVGSTMGMKALIKATWPEKEVLVIDGQHSDSLAFMNEPDEDVPDEVYAASLGIVIDTATEKRISNPKYALCKELIKIDHHIEREPYAPLCWVEEERSSACEMIADFYSTFQSELKITQKAASCIYAGMVTDSGRFRYSEVNGETLRLGALLLDQGIDTEQLFAHLYLREFESLQFKAYVYGHMQRTENGVAYIRITLEMQEKFGLTFEMASAAISYLDCIKGCLCWLAFIEAPDGATRVRLRSRFVTINQVAENYRGGGHAYASGATVYGEEEKNALIREADETVRSYKETHDNWL